MRSLDISLSVIGLVVLSPLLLLLALAVKVSSPGPVLYRARRVGKDGRVFTLYKFRSMAVRQEGQAPRVTGHDDPRITRVGRVLRRTKLDELPQLFNTLIGDMALVGPRPEDPFYVKWYSDRQLEVLRVRPGITSPATLSHRNEEAMLTGPDFEEKYRREILPAKLRIELDYLSERTLSTDVRILAQTAVALFRNPTTGDSTRGSSECRS